MAAVVGIRRYIRGYTVPRDSSIFEVVQGRWAWSTREDGCDTDWHTISFSPARDTMFIASAKPFEGADDTFDSVTTYVIHEHTLSRIRGAIPGEARFTADGEPVVWDLVLRSPDRYAWRRADWPGWGFTAAIERCVE
jgi:hypothetical protein